MAYLSVCVWMVPFGFFVSLSSSGDMLPGIQMTDGTTFGAYVAPISLVFLIIACLSLSNCRVSSFLIGASVLLVPGNKMSCLAASEAHVQ